MIREDLQFKYKVKVQQQDIREKVLELILLSGKKVSINMKVNFI